MVKGIDIHEMSVDKEKRNSCLPTSFYRNHNSNQLNKNIIFNTRREEEQPINIF